VSLARPPEDLDRHALAGGATTPCKVWSPSASTVTSGSPGWMRARWVSLKFATT
jgi:hypothetical protein